MKTVNLKINVLALIVSSMLFGAFVQYSLSKPKCNAPEIVTVKLRSLDKMQHVVFAKCNKKDYDRLEAWELVWTGYDSKTGTTFIDGSFEYSSNEEQELRPYIVAWNK